MLAKFVFQEGRRPDSDQRCDLEKEGDPDCCCCAGGKTGRERVSDCVAEERNSHVVEGYCGLHAVGLHELHRDGACDTHRRKNTDKDADIATQELFFSKSAKKSQIFNSFAENLTLIIW
jgi:hypothetical protein